MTTADTPNPDAATTTEDTMTDLPALTHTNGLPDYLIKQAIDARDEMLDRLAKVITQHAPDNAPAELVAEMIQLLRGALIRQTRYGWWMASGGRHPVDLAGAVMTKAEKARRLEISQALAATTTATDQTSHHIAEYLARPYYTLSNPTDRSDALSLSPREIDAHALWINRWRIREAEAGHIDTAPRPRDAAPFAAIDDVCAALVTAVEMDVAGTPTTRTLGNYCDVACHVAEFEAARRIQRIYRELTGWSPVVLPVDTSTQCRHGVEYDADCAECDAEF